MLIHTFFYIIKGGVIMSRFDIIEKEINKSVKVDEKSNVVIQGWSPNNVRRLIIGVDYVIVQYFVKTGKYAKLIDIVPLGKSTEDDFLNLQDNKYTPILKVLTANRIISSIEEILFCVKGYPKELLDKDIELGVLGKGSNLNTRFVRLHNISVVNKGVKDIVPYLQSSTDSDKLLIDSLSTVPGNSIKVKSLLELHKDDWFNGTNLRSRWYSMDKEGSVLHTYFIKLKEDKELEDRENRLKEIEFKKYETLANTELKNVIALISTILYVVGESGHIVDKLSVIDRLEWGNTLKIDKIHSACRRSLASVPKGADENYEPLSNLLRRVDICGLKEIADKFKLVNSDKLVNFDDFSKQLLQYNANYRRDTNKASIIDSVDILQKGVIKLLNTLINSLYLVLIQYCSKAGIDNVSYYVYELNLDITLLNYTRPMVAYCNNQTKKENSGDILKAMGCNLVEVDNLTTEYKVKNLKYILDKLKSI